jgi:hypothetical protein
MCLVGDPNAGGEVTTKRANPWETHVFTGNNMSGTIHAELYDGKRGGWDGKRMITGVIGIDVSGVKFGFEAGGPTCSRIRSGLSGTISMNSVSGETKGVGLYRSMVGPSGWGSAAETCVKEKIRGVLFSVSEGGGAVGSGFSESLERSGVSAGVPANCIAECLNSASCSVADDDDAMARWPSASVAFKVAPLIIADLKGLREGYSILV